MRRAVPEVASRQGSWDAFWQRELAQRRWREPNPWLRRQVEQQHHPGGMRVLDFGCGRGRHTLYLASRGFQVYASDISLLALEGCRQALEGSSLRAELVLAPPNRVPFREGVFGWVIAFNVVYHNTLAGIRETIAELSRALEAGGYLLFTLLSLRHFRYGRGEEIEPDTFVLRDPSFNERDIPHHFSPSEEIPGLFSGFRLLEEAEIAQTEPDSPGGAVHWHIMAQKGGGPLEEARR